jgi:lipopolysaccharide biosynthesis regulator YciM
MLTAARMMMTAIWDMEAVRTSETLVYFNEITQHYIPEGCDLQCRNCFFGLSVGNTLVEGVWKWVLTP